MIIISPFAKRYENQKFHAKDYPYWKELISLIKNEKIIQIGVKEEEQLVDDFRKNLKMKEIEELVKECKFWISVDNFLQHLVHYVGGKSGVVLWGISNPEIFGYPENINTYRDQKYFRQDQFFIWRDIEPNLDAFIKPEEVYEKIKEKFYD